MKTRLLTLATALLFMAGMAVAQTSGDNGQPQSSTQPATQNSTGQNSQAGTTQPGTAQSTTTGNAAATSQSTSDQSAVGANSENAESLPQTASPLPLLALLGMGGVTAGALGRRKK